ncbi:hypothetical protein SAVIM40S_05404 [Streptomyces avidinii]
MYVRSIYATGDPAELDGVAEALRTDGRALLSAQRGFRGMGLFADRELGKLLVGSWWEDEASRQASYENLSKRRAEMMAPFAQTVTVDNWEAAVARRAEELGPDAGFRLVHMDVEPADIDLLVDTFRDTSLPKVQKVPGLAGISLLIDAVHLVHDLQRSYRSARTDVQALRPSGARRLRVGRPADRIQYGINNGRLVPTKRRHRKGRPLVADYVLEYVADVPIAVVEAKRYRLSVENGVEQARRYARKLGLRFAYATNGREIVEIDFSDLKRPVIRDIHEFPAGALGAVPSGTGCE